MNFVTFYFETATKEANSACSLAVIRFRDGKPVESLARLCQPPENHYEDDTIRIHQIRPADTANAPTFAEIWPEFVPYFEHDLVFAHNAEFDTTVLRNSLAHYGLSLPYFEFGCTVQMARKVWPNLPSYALNNLGKLFGYEFHHHQADEDALICGNLVLQALREKNLDDPRILLSTLEIGPQIFQAESGFLQDALF